MWLKREEFEELVAEALDEIPAELAAKLSNVEVVVEDKPDNADLLKLGLSAGATLFGLYQGVPQNKRGTYYHLTFPDRITLFKAPIESRCRNRQEVKDQVKRTVIHEIAHHFGFGEKRIRELGY